MIYSIKDKTNKEWNGKPFVEATLIDTDLKEFKVSAWNGEFSGDTWEGDLEKNDKGYWKLVTKKAVAGANFKTQMMDRKENSIAKAQDNKEWSIKLASSMGKAIDLAIAEIQDIKTLNTLEQDILKWRKWILDNWDIDYKDIKPF